MSGALKPVYLVHGDDEVKLDAWRQRLAQRARDEPDASFEALAGDRVGGAALTEAAAAMTLAMGTRYLLVDGIEKFKEADVKQAAGVLAAPPEDTVLLLLATGKVSRGKGPAPAKLVKAVEKAGGEVHLCASPRQAKLPAWIAQRAAELDKSIGREAAMLLIERVGTRQSRLVRELEKLAMYCESDTIEADDVEAIVVGDADPRAYSLGDAIVRNERIRALAVAEELREAQTDLMPIVYALMHKLRQTRTAWAMIGAGSSPQEIQAALKASPWVAKRVCGEARDADGERLEIALGELAELDYAIRGGSDLDPWTALTLSIGRMVSPGRAAA